LEYKIPSIADFVVSFFPQYLDVSAHQLDSRQREKLMLEVETGLNSLRKGGHSDLAEIMEAQYDRVSFLELERENPTNTVH